MRPSEEVHVMGCCGCRVGRKEGCWGGGVQDGATYTAPVARVASVDGSIDSCRVVGNAIT